MEALTKWIGSKVKFLDEILPLVPADVVRYVEPFVGGGCLYMGIHDCGKFVINDDCEELMELWREAEHPSRIFLSHIQDINTAWRNITKVFEAKSNLLMQLYEDFPEGQKYDYLKYVETLNPVLRQISYDEVFPQRYTGDDAFEMEKRFRFSQMKSRSRERKFRSSEQLEEYILTSLKTALYSYYTELYNSKQVLPEGLRKALLLYLLHFSANGQFVFDRQGEFRPVYAGVGHNVKSLDGKLQLLADDKFKERLEKTQINCMDFRKFLTATRQAKGDFLMVDPPLGKMCKKVGDKTFSEQDWKDLLAYLEGYRQRWMMLVKSSDITPEIDRFAKDRFVRYAGFHKEVMIITNYDTTQIA